MVIYDLDVVPSLGDARSHDILDVVGSIPIGSTIENLRTD
jgi:hypothetical protein